mmetsp:Transcript_19016/g.38394  ORF Transcript_19016/g.38394 Transcript_19016/m.38394 type:complete len:384 (-) Transcript_19016:196-1347(-)
MPCQKDGSLQVPLHVGYPPVGLRNLPVFQRMEKPMMALVLPFRVITRMQRMLLRVPLGHPTLMMLHQRMSPTTKPWRTTRFKRTMVSRNMERIIHLTIAWQLSIMEKKKVTVQVSRPMVDLVVPTKAPHPTPHLVLAAPVWNPPPRLPIMSPELPPPSGLMKRTRLKETTKRTLLRVTMVRVNTNEKVPPRRTGMVQNPIRKSSRMKKSMRTKQRKRTKPRTNLLFKLMATNAMNLMILLLVLMKALSREISKTPAGDWKPMKVSNLSLSPQQKRETGCTKISTPSRSHQKLARNTFLRTPTSLIRTSPNQSAIPPSCLVTLNRVRSRQHLRMTKGLLIQPLHLPRELHQGGSSSSVGTASIPILRMTRSTMIAMSALKANGQ